MTKKVIKLDKWSVVGFSADPYKAPEQNIAALAGVVTGHPKQKDGTTVVTSPLTMISYKNKIATTMNTEYVLGEPDPQFVEYLRDNGYTIDQYEMGRLDS